MNQPLQFIDTVENKTRRIKNELKVIHVDLPDFLKYAAHRDFGNSADSMKIHRFLSISMERLDGMEKIYKEHRP